MTAILRSVLITGGATGIGFALAERFLASGAEVAICGRRRDRLRAARKKHPGLRTLACDVSTEAGRKSLWKWSTGELPGLNVLVHNAGIQRRVPLGARESWRRTHEELAANLEAPIHLTKLFLPLLRRQKEATIVIVSSGLAFAPLALAPIYSATKAAIHSFTLSLRHELAGTPVRVVEIIPPAVHTDLGGPGLHDFGVPVDEFADAVFARLEAGDLEIPYGTAEKASRASREELDEIFRRMNSRTAP